MYKRKLIILLGVVLISTSTLLAQQVQSPTHQKYVYGDGYGYIAKDILWVNNQLIISGYFQNEGSHPIATRFNSKGEWVNDMYWKNLKGELSHASIVNDTCLLFYGGHSYASSATLSTYSLQPRDPSYHDEGQQIIGKEQIICFYRGKQLVHVMKSYTGIKLVVKEPGKDDLLSSVSIERSLFYVNAFVSDTKKTLYLFPHSGGDYHNETIYQIDISDLAKPVVKSKTYSGIWYQGEDLVTEVTDEGFTIVSNVYLTSPPDAEQATWTEEKSIQIYTTKDGYIDLVSKKSIPNEFRSATYMAKITNDRYLMVWLNWAGVSAYIYNSNLEMIHSLDYSFDKEMELKLCDDPKHAVIRLLDSETFGIFYPYNTPESLEEPISTWEFFSFKIK